MLSLLALYLSVMAGAGRASDAVEESIGVAREEDTTAGTEVALIARARRTVRSAADVGLE